MNAATAFDIAAIDNIEAEQGLLGALMLHNDAIGTVRSKLLPEHFSESLHRDLYAAILAAYDKSDDANVLTLRPALGAADMLVGDVKLPVYLARLVSEAMGSASVKGLAKAVIVSWQKRKLVAECQDLIKRACTSSDEPAALAEGLGDVIIDIVNAGADAKRSKNYGDLLYAAMQVIQDRRNDDTGVMRWFLPEVNEVVGIVRPGNLVGLMSDSGGGKTSFSASQCRFMAECGVPTAFFSIEVTDAEAALQVAAQRVGVSLREIDEGDLLSGKLEAVLDEAATGTRLPFVVESFDRADVPEIRARIALLKKRMGLQFVMIDHAKMIRLPGRSTDIFAERVNELYRELKGIAKATGVAIVILIQRNGDWKKRDNPRPVPGDAYGGDGVKQNVDSFFSLYRPEPLYRDMRATASKEAEKGRLSAKITEVEGKAWIINHKRRRGEALGWREVRFDAEITLFRSSRPPSDLPPELFE